MNKKYLLLMVVLLCFSSFAYSLDVNNIELNYGNLSLSTTVIDLANNYNGTMYGGMSLTGWNFSFDGSDDYIDSDYNTYNNNIFSFSLWVKNNGDYSDDGQIMMFSQADQSNKITFWQGTNTLIGFGCVGDSGASYPSTSQTISTTEFENYIIVQNSTNLTLYRNGVKISEGSSCGTVTITDNVGLQLGQNNLAGDKNSFNGYISNFIVFDDELTQTEITEIYNNGRTYDYSVPIPIDFSYPYEESNTYKQTNPITITSTEPQTIIDTTITKTEATQGYFVFSGNIVAESNPPPDMDCNLKLNDVEVGANLTYENPVLDNKYAFYGQTLLVDYVVGENTLIAQCSGSSSKQFTISNTVLTAFEQFDTDDYNFTIFNSFFNFSVNSPAAFIPTVSNLVPIPQYNYSESNKSTYVIYSAGLIASYPTDNTAHGYLTIDDKTCGTASRYGETGQTGSGNFICSKKFNNSETFFNITSWNKGIYDIEVRSAVKFLALYDYEHDFEVLTEKNLTSGNGWEDISVLHTYIDNIDKGIYAVASISAQGIDVPIETIYRVIITGVNGSLLYRDFTGANQEGIVGYQDAFTNLPIGNYTVSLQGYTNGTAPDQAQVINGNFIIYVEGSDDLNPNDFEITAVDTIFGSSVQSFTANDGLTLSTTTGSIYYPKQEGFINLTFTGDNYFNYTVYNHNTSNDLEFNATPYPWINFTFTEYFSSNKVSNFTLTCDNGYISALADGDSLLYQMNGNVTSTTCTFTHPDYATTEFNVTGIVTSSLNTHTQNVFTSNSILMSFYDQSNLSLITNNVSVEVIGTFQTATNWTITGSTYFDLLSPDTYSIRYSAPGYNTNTYYLTLVNKTNNNLTFYMSANTSTIAVTATVYDEKTQFVEDARIKVLIEDPSNPSQYITTQMCDTNFEGVCSLDLILDIKQYKFIIEYPFGTVKKITNPSYIFDAAIDFQIIIGDLAAEDFVATKDVYGVVEYLNDSFTFTYNDPNNGISQGCLNIYSINPTGKTLYSVDCRSSVGEVITANITAVNGTSYLAQGIVYYGSEAIPLDEAYKSYKAATSGFGLNGAFLLLFVVITFSAIAMWNPVILITFLPLPLTLGKFMGFLEIEWLPLLGLHFAFILIAYLISDRG